MRALYTTAGRVPLARVAREYRAALVPLAVILGINLVVLIALVLPLSQRVSTNQQRAEAAERQRGIALAELRRAEALRDGKAQATEDLETFYAQVLPGDVAAARRILQLKLQQKARAHDVQYQGGGSTEEAINRSSLLRLSIQMRLTGEYEAIRSFIYDVETSPDFMIIDNLKLAEGIDEDAPLSVYLAVSTYYRAPASGVARTAADGR